MASLMRTGIDKTLEAVRRQISVWLCYGNCVNYVKY